MLAAVLVLGAVAVVLAVMLVVQQYRHDNERRYLTELAIATVSPTAVATVRKPREPREPKPPPIKLSEGVD